MTSYELLLSPPRRRDRSAFLRSYTFQVRESRSYRERVVRSFKELDLIKRGLKELDEMRKVLVVRISRHVADWRFISSTRVFRSFRLKLLSGFGQFDPLRCFAGIRKGDCSDDLA